MISGLLVFGLLGGCFLSVLVGIIGARRNIGFGLAFLVSVLFTPLVGLIVAMISDPLPYGERNWGCLGSLFGALGTAFLTIFLILLILILI